MGEGEGREEKGGVEGLEHEWTAMVEAVCALRTSLFCVYLARAYFPFLCARLLLRFPPLLCNINTRQPSSRSMSSSIQTSTLTAHHVRRSRSPYSPADHTATTSFPRPGSSPTEAAD